MYFGFRCLLWRENKMQLILFNPGRKSAKFMHKQHTSVRIANICMVSFVHRIRCGFSMAYTIEEFSVLDDLVTFNVRIYALKIPHTNVYFN